MLEISLATKRETGVGGGRTVFSSTDNLDHLQSDQVEVTPQSRQRHVIVT